MKRGCIVALASVVLGLNALAQFDRGHGNRPGPPQGAPGRGPQWGRGGGRGFGSEHFIGTILGDGELARKAGVSEEQIETIKQELNGLKQRANELRSQLELAGMEQAEIMTAEEIDEDALMAAVEKTGKINTELAKLRVKHLLAIKKNISSEQLAKVKELVHDRMRQRFREHREGGRGHWGEGADGNRRRPPQRRGEEGARPPRSEEGEDRL